MSPPAVFLSSSLLQVCNVLVEGLLGTRKRTDEGALVVPEVALDMCLREDEPFNRGVPKENGVSFIPAVSFVPSAGPLWPEVAQVAQVFARK